MSQSMAKLFLLTDADALEGNLTLSRLTTLLPPLIMQPLRIQFHSTTDGIQHTTNNFRTFVHLKIYDFFMNVSANESN